MKTKEFNWTLNGYNNKKHQISMELSTEEVQHLINYLYEKNPNETQPCEFCKNFNDCAIKHIETNCQEYEEQK